MAEVLHQPPPHQLVSSPQAATFATVGQQDQTPAVQFAPPAKWKPATSPGQPRERNLAFIKALRAEREAKGRASSSATSSSSILSTLGEQGATSLMILYFRKLQSTSGRDIHLEVV